MLSLFSIFLSSICRFVFTENIDRYREMILYIVLYKCVQRKYINVFFSVGNYACVLLDGGGKDIFDARFKS